MSADSGSGASKDDQKPATNVAIGSVERNIIAGAVFGSFGGSFLGLSREFVLINWNDIQLWKLGRMLTGIPKGIIVGGLAGASYALILEGMERITKEKKPRNHFVAGAVTCIPFALRCTLCFAKPRNTCLLTGFICYCLAAYNTQPHVTKYFDTFKPVSRCRYPEMYLYNEAFNRTAEEDIRRLKELTSKVSGNP